MSSVPNNPSGDVPPPPLWSNESDWIAIIEFLPRHDVEVHVRATEAIRHMLAYAQMTDTRMLTLIGDPQADAYELLFSFDSTENKAEFLCPLQSNELTARENEMIMAPRQAEIDKAQPIADILPQDVIRRVTLAATMLLGGQIGMIQ
jgi:hypothetical protein